MVTELLKKRRKLAAVRLRFTPEAPEEMKRLLCEKLMLPAKHCFAQAAPLELSFLFKIYNRLSAERHNELRRRVAKNKVDV